MTHIRLLKTTLVCLDRAEKGAAAVASVQVVPSDELQTSFIPPLLSVPPITHILFLKTRVVCPYRPEKGGRAAGCQSTPNSAQTGIKPPNANQHKINAPNQQRLANLWHR